MSVKTGYACGTCGACGKAICEPRPADIAVCDCHRYCPLCKIQMAPYAADLTPSTYDSGEINAIMKCPNCGYKSRQKPVEVPLT